MINIRLLTKIQKVLTIVISDPPLPTYMSLQISQSTDWTDFWVLPSQLNAQLVSRRHQTLCYRSWCHRNANNIRFCKAYLPTMINKRHIFQKSACILADIISGQPLILIYIFHILLISSQYNYKTHTPWSIQKKGSQNGDVLKFVHIRENMSLELL